MGISIRALRTVLFAACGLGSGIPLGLPAATPPAPTILYATGFEVSEGYSFAAEFLPLRGQMGWVGQGSGGNGLLDEFFEGWGQQAYVGFTPPAPKDEVLHVWRPVGALAPSPPPAVLKFSVLMQIVDSTNGEYDDFRWSAHNTPGSRLFTMDFDNSRGEIFYALDDATGYRSTGFAFSNDAVYDLSVYMNLSRNTWMAMMNGVVVIDSQPITTINARLDLDDMDAVWAIRKQGMPGNNYMLFDDYVVTIEPGATIPPLLEILGRHPTGEFELLLHGERGLTYAIDVSTDMVNWEPLATQTLTSSGAWDFIDDTAPDYPLSFYRARELR